MKWFIELLGNETDLIGLEASLRSEATTIVREERKFFLTLSVAAKLMKQRRKYCDSLALAVSTG